VLPLPTPVCLLHQRINVPVHARGSWELEIVKFYYVFRTFTIRTSLSSRCSNLPLETGSVNAEALTAAMQMTRYPETTTAVHTAIIS